MWKMLTSRVTGRIYLMFNPVMLNGFMASAFAIRIDRNREPHYGAYYRDTNRSITLLPRTLLNYTIEDV